MGRAWSVERGERDAEDTCYVGNRHINAQGAVFARLLPLLIYRTGNYNVVILMIWCIYLGIDE